MGELQTVHLDARLKGIYLLAGRRHTRYAKFFNRHVKQFCRFWLPRPKLPYSNALLNLPGKVGDGTLNQNQCCWPNQPQLNVAFRVRCKWIVICAS